MSNIWDITKNISEGGNHLFKDPDSAELTEKEYVSFMVNRSMSYHYDTVQIANMVNAWAHIPKSAQYEFYKSTVKPKKRFSKWPKPEKSDLINTIMEELKCNRQVAETYLSLLNEEQITLLKNKNNNKGG